MRKDKEHNLLQGGFFDHARVHFPVVFSSLNPRIWEESEITYFPRIMNRVHPAAMHRQGKKRKNCEAGEYPAHPAVFSIDSGQGEPSEVNRRVASPNTRLLVPFASPGSRETLPQPFLANFTATRAFCDLYFTEIQTRS
jgi:hypothetical protein